MHWVEYFSTGATDLNDNHRSGRSVKTCNNLVRRSVILVTERFDLNRTEVEKSEVWVLPKKVSFLVKTGYRYELLFFHV